jgi:CRP-like cAMP-binding protein
MELTDIFHKKFDRLSKEAIHCYLWLADEVFVGDLQDGEYVVTRSRPNLAKVLGKTGREVSLTLKELKESGLIRLEGRKIILVLHLKSRGRMS